MQTMDEISPTFSSVHNFCKNLVTLSCKTCFLPSLQHYFNSDYMTMKHQYRIRCQHIHVTNVYILYCHSSLEVYNFSGLGHYGYFNSFS